MLHCHFSSFMVGWKSDENFPEKTKCDEKNRKLTIKDEGYFKTSVYFFMIFIILYQTKNEYKGEMTINDEINGGAIDTQKI